MNIDSGKLNGLRTGAARSPFRYPGGKAFFAETLARSLSQLPKGDKVYLEPYAGGAGSALRLLAAKQVERIYLNDADTRVFSAWRALVEENSRFRETLRSVQLSMDSWYAYRDVVNEPSLAQDSFELGFATFFLNRTNRSGILQGSGPIGGYAQGGPWKLDARFNREDMLRRVEWIGRQARRIIISNEDGLEFLKRTSNEVDLDRALYFVDPPYVTAGSRLYMNGMQERDHRRLGAYLCSRIVPNWIVTYDDCKLIRDIYNSAAIETLEVRYSLQRKRLEGEVLITPN